LVAADHRRIIGGALAGALDARHCYKKVRVFGWKKRER
jgi:hypothetical protein